jgi:tetraacyldisaccharide 4'-kinase
MLYRIILAARHFLFDKGWKKSYKADVPTVCVGNLTVGGTGKTPHTEMILSVLLHSDEWAYSDIAVLSRGYKRKTPGFQKVGRDGTALLFGDEPLQIAKKFPSVTVAVDKDRVEGCRFLAHPEELQTAKKARKCLDKDIPKADIILLDDAFQYRRLRADVNIVLVDYNRPVHKDKLMPWGRLRDLPSRLKAADILIVTKCPSYLDEWEKGKWAKQLGVENYSTASCTGVRKLRKKKEKVQTLLFSTIGYEPMAPVYPDEADSRFMYAQRLILFTGIAKDTPLRAYLSDKYKEVKRFSFPDHHKYTSGDVAKVARAVREFPTACVATTEKDAQRIVDTKKVPETLRQRLFQVPITVGFLTPAEKEIFETTLLNRLRELRSES